MWRSIERASLEKKPSMRLSHHPCVGVNVKVKRPMGCAASQLVVSRETWAEWLSRMLSRDFAHRPLGELAEARMPGRGSVLPGCAASSRVVHSYGTERYRQALGDITPITPDDLWARAAEDTSRKP